MTDSDGRFAFEREDKTRFLLVIGDKTFTYDVCAEIDDEIVLLWSSSDFGAVYGPVTLECDLNAPVREVERDRGRCDAHRGAL